MDDYKILLDEKEMRAEKRRKELEEFKRRIDAEKAERDLIRVLRAGLCTTKGIIDELEGELWYSAKQVLDDKPIVTAAKELICAALKLEKAMGVDDPLPEGQTVLDDFVREEE